MSDEGHTFDTALQQATAALGIAMTPAQQALLFAHYAKVVEANRQFNLTRITSPGDAAVKHYADSLSLLAMPEFRPADRLDVLDVGTGAGFPAVPLAIVCEGWSITAIDGTGKKARIVARAADDLGLQNLHVRQARAADLVREKGHDFDAVVLRAVSTLADGLAEVAPLVRAGGSVIFYKTPHVDAAEVAEAERVAHKQGFHKHAPFDLMLSSAEGSMARRLLRYQRL